MRLFIWWIFARNIVKQTEYEYGIGDIYGKNVYMAVRLLCIGFM